MSIIIDIYTIICGMLLLFDIGFLITKNLKSRKFYPQNMHLRKMIKAELIRYSPEVGFGSDMSQFLEKKISKTKNLVVLMSELEKIDRNKAKIKTEVHPYILKKIEEYKKKSDYEQAYYAYVVSCFDYEKEDYRKKFYSLFLEFLDSNSLYVFSNTMDAIYNFKDPYIMLAAIKKVDEREGFYHSKLFIDGLLEFKGDTDRLHKMIVEKFYDYSPLLQESLLNYFRIKGTDIATLCLDIIKNRTAENEVLYAAMRYFEKYPCEEAKYEFLYVLRNERAFWIEQLIAIKGLMHYSDFPVKKAVKDKITSKNWYIRTNAINYLHNHMTGKSEIAEIVRLDDNYTNEALRYYYKDDREVLKYIESTISAMSKTV